MKRKEKKQQKRQGEIKICKKKLNIIHSLRNTCYKIGNFRKREKNLKNVLEQDDIVLENKNNKIDISPLETEVMKLEKQEEVLGESYFKKHKDFELEFGKILSH